MPSLTVNVEGPEMDHESLVSKSDERESSRHIATALPTKTAELGEVEQQTESGNLMEPAMDDLVMQFRTSEPDIDQQSEQQSVDEQTSNPWNAYVYVVGTDVTGGGDFNRMRELLVRQTALPEPRVIVTYDFKNKQLRKTWQASDGRVVPNPQAFPLGEDFSVVYSDIAAFPRNNQRVRELHFLTHFIHDKIRYQPGLGSSVDDLIKTVNPTNFAHAFARDARIKIHGCQHDEEGSIPQQTRAFCTAGPAEQRKTLKDARARISESFPFRLASIVGMPVWASPLGAGAFYSCSYLDRTQQERTLCIESAANPPKTSRNPDQLTFHRTLRFYQSNYDQIFDRSANEPIFDDTFHMKYKSSLRALSEPRPTPCQRQVYPGGLIPRSTGGEETGMPARLPVEHYLVTLVEEMITAGHVTSPRSLLSYLTAEMGRTPVESSTGETERSLWTPREIFRAFTSPGKPARRSLNEWLEVVVRPGEMPTRAIQPGDVLLRMIEGSSGHAAIIAGYEAWPVHQLPAGVTPESWLQGWYVEVVEGGPSPHVRADGFARQLLDASGRMLRNQLLLRPRGTDTTDIATVEESSAMVQAAAPDAASLAREVLANPGITPASIHTSGVVDNANARQNLQDTEKGLQAARSSYGGAPGGVTPLDTRMLTGLRELGRTYTFSISELAGGAHSRNSRHYVGLAADVNIVNGKPVRASHLDVPSFKDACRSLGATEILGPGNPGHDTHIHCAWPRTSATRSTTELLDRQAEPTAPESEASVGLGADNDESAVTRCGFFDLAGGLRTESAVRDKIVDVATVEQDSWINPVTHHLIRERVNSQLPSLVRYWLSVFRAIPAGNLIALQAAARTYARYPNLIGPTNVARPAEVNRLVEHLVLNVPDPTSPADLEDVVRQAIGRAVASRRPVPPPGSAAPKPIAWSGAYI